MLIISKKIEKAIEMIVKPIIEDRSYEYVGTELRKAGDALELIIYADKPGGLGLDDCEAISKSIDDAIDKADPIEDAYFLCVSSPGLDMPLRNPSDFERSVGKDIDVKLYRAVDGEKSFTGKLNKYDDVGFIVVINNEERSFEYTDTAIVRLHVDI